MPKCHSERAGAGEIRKSEHQNKRPAGWAGRVKLRSLGLDLGLVGRDLVGGPAGLGLAVPLAAWALGAVAFGAGQPGFGVSIVPLRYTSAATLAKTAENFLTRPGAVRVDYAHGIRDGADAITVGWTGPRLR